jgi:hypothetical protein
VTRLASPLSAKSQCPFDGRRKLKNNCELKLINGRMFTIFRNVTLGKIMEGVFGILLCLYSKQLLTIQLFISPQELVLLKFCEISRSTSILQSYSRHGSNPKPSLEIEKAIINEVDGRRRRFRSRLVMEEPWILLRQES